MRENDLYLRGGRLYVGGGSTSSGRILHSWEHLPLDRFCIRGQIWGMQRLYAISRKWHRKNQVSRKLKVMSDILCSLFHTENTCVMIQDLPTRPTDPIFAHLTELPDKLFLSFQFTVFCLFFLPYKSLFCLTMWKKYFASRLFHYTTYCKHAE